MRKVSNKQQMSAADSHQGADQAGMLDETMPILFLLFILKDQIFISNVLILELLDGRNLITQIKDFMFSKTINEVLWIVSNP